MSPWNVGVSDKRAAPSRSYPRHTEARASVDANTHDVRFLGTEFFNRDRNQPRRSPFIKARRDTTEIVSASEIIRIEDR